MSKMTDLAREYRMPTQTTPEDLETRWRKVLTFGYRVLLVGYYYHPDGNFYFAAVYEFLDDDHTCEGFIGLRAVSQERFKDDGHAIEWAFKQNKKTKEFQILGSVSRSGSRWAVFFMT